MRSFRFLSFGLLTHAALALSAHAQFVLNEDFFSFGYDDAEITPDGQYVVARENSFNTTTHVFDAATGASVFESAALFGAISGEAQDAVAVTNDRAVVIGSNAMFVDLTTLTTLAQHDVGITPRDVAITPDGTLAVIRGGSGLTGGLHIFDLATGFRVAQAPGEPPTAQNLQIDDFDVDSVVCDNEHAVCTSFVQTMQGPTTRVTIWDLTPMGGGPPVVAFETTTGTDLEGWGHDIALAPNGAFAAVRSGLEVGLFRLSGASSGILWIRTPFGDPGPFGLSAMDSIEVTNTRILTLSRYSGDVFAMQVDLFNLAGNQWYERVGGDPHDLVILPSGTRAVVRSNRAVYLFDIQTLPQGTNEFAAISMGHFPGTHTSFGAGLDSLAANDEQVVALSRVGIQTDVALYDLIDDRLVLSNSFVMNDLPLDVQFTPDATKAAVVGLTRVLVIDLRTGELIFEHDPTIAPGNFPWCDGIAVNDTTLAAFGVGFPNAGAGWISIIDLFDSQQSNYCQSNANSSGDAATIHATGSPSLTSNNFELWATGLPKKTFGFFALSQSQQNTPLGNGFQCLGTALAFPIRQVPGGGVAREEVDLQNTPGVTFMPGVFTFQYFFRDSVGAGFDSSDGLSVTFVN